MKQFIKDLKLHFRTLGLRGAACFLGAKINKKTNYITVTHPDCKHRFELRVPSSDLPTYCQVFRYKEYAFESVRDTPKVIVDAGANIGLASIYFANRFPDAKIIAIEPELSNFELLKKNVASYSNIFPVQAALWNENDEIDLIDPGLGKWGFMTMATDEGSPPHIKSCHRVKAMTVDKIMQEFNLERIDILKIDIEGAEKEVFEDTRLWLDRVDAIIIELHERMKAGCNRSFYNGSSGFDQEWQLGENIYLSRIDCISKK